MQCLQFYYYEEKFENFDKFKGKKKVSLNFLINLLLIYKRLNMSTFKAQNSAISPSRASSSEKSRSRSRQKKPNRHPREDQIYKRKFISDQAKLHESSNPISNENILNFSKPVDSIINSAPQSDKFREVVRSLLRIEQGRDQTIDKFAKIMWIYKNRIRYDHTLHQIMTQPKKFISKLSNEHILSILPIAQEHKQYQLEKKTQFQQYWNTVVGMLQRKINKSENNNTQIKQDYKYKVKQIITKPLPELIKLERQAVMILKNKNFGSSGQYWKYVLEEVKEKKTELILQKYYQDYKSTHQKIIDQNLKEEDQFVHQQPTSPKLLPFTSVNSKLIVHQEEEKQWRKKLAQKIFMEEFQKGQERLQRNLSLPHNHSLLSTQIITQQTKTYDQITKEIIQFKKYQRMEDDEEEFNDWVPCETQGRFRDQKPYYLNRVRVACEWNKYNSTHYTEENPPPKTIQGYKFNIFYPELYDKQKTPQYYLENTDDPNFCLIKFKAGPPYKDVAFKVLKKQWDFTQKSGFESIFSKGILQMYFNFKKPKYRI